MIRKVIEVVPMVRLKCGGRMKVIAFITEDAGVDQIIDHLKLRFVAAMPLASRFRVVSGPLGSPGFPLLDKDPWVA